MRASKRDSTLESNFFTAYVPRFPIFDRVTHAAETAVSLVRGLFRGLCGSKPADPPPLLRPPGDVPQISLPDSEPDALRRSCQIKLKSRETLRDQPMLDPAQANNALRYRYATNRAWNPSSEAEDDVLEDAFTCNDLFSGDIAAKATMAESTLMPLLPPEVTNSTLLNSTSPGAEGQVSDEIVNQLVDKRTGFSAAISYDPEQREVIIGFSGVGSQGMNLRQLGRCFLQWLGFVPKNLSQASQLTRLVKEHLEKINAALPEEKKIILTLTGHSMGGGLASYAALRNKVPAIVTNPMRLGNGARARIGQLRIDEASKYITELVIQGDYLSDNPLSWLYLAFLGVSSFGTLGTARRFMIPHVRANEGPHNDVTGSLQTLAFLDTFLDSIRAALSTTPYQSERRENFEDELIREADDPEWTRRRLEGKRARDEIDAERVLAMLDSKENHEALFARRDFRPLLETLLPAGTFPEKERKSLIANTADLLRRVASYHQLPNESVLTYAARLRGLLDKFGEVLRQYDKLEELGATPLHFQHFFEPLYYLHKELAMQSDRVQQLLAYAEKLRALESPSEKKADPGEPESPASVLS